MGLRSWTEWSDEVSACVRAVPDELLLRVARVLARAPIVITAGNGGSSTLAAHAAQALMKPGRSAGGGCAAVCLNEAVPTMTAHANDGGWETALLEAARPFMSLRDQSGDCLSPVLWLFSSSGKSANVVRLATVFRAWPIIAFTGFEGEPLRSLARLSVHVPSNDYEVVEPVHDAFLHRVQAHLRHFGGVGDAV